MAELKTRPNEADVTTFLESVADKARRQDCLAVLELMQEVTGCPPRMWGDSIVGFGSYHYRYASGREGDWFLTGFSPRKNDLTLYVMVGLTQSEERLRRLGKCKTGKSCLYVKKLADINSEVLRELIQESVEALREGRTC